MQLKDIRDPITDVDALVSAFKADPRGMQAIKLGKKRDNCGVVSVEFADFAKRRGFKALTIEGEFRVDNPTFDKIDFLDKEIDQMERAGYDSDSEEDRIAFAEKYNLMDQLKLVPHFWNEVDGKLIDLSGQFQFVNTGMASDLSKDRYISHKRID